MPPSLACPESAQALRPRPLAEAERVAGKLVARVSAGRPPVGPTPTVLLRADGSCAYPVVDGIPVLLRPERLTPPERRVAVDLGAAVYAEAYEEMDFYDTASARSEELLRTGRVAELERRSERLRTLGAVARTPAARRGDFPEPRRLWIDAPHDPEAEYDAYRHLAPVRGRRMLQIGGEGVQALLFLLAGAVESVLLSPMLGELRFARALARHHGVADRLHVVCAIAEELPFPPASFDGVFAGGCVHHMVTERALPEVARVLVPGGRFAAAEPWRAPGYGLGTRLLGKREDVHCRPLTHERVAPLFTSFAAARVVHHGTLTRYALIAASKAGVSLRAPLTSRIQRADDAACSLVPSLRRLGSSVALVATAGGPPDHDQAAGSSHA